MITHELHVLVLEDDEFERCLITHMLRNMGISKLSAVADGNQALNLLRLTDDHPVDIVICDLNMPEMDGLEFIRHVSQEHIDVALIIISAFGIKLLGSAERMSKLYGIKLLGVVDKPLMPDHLDRLFKQLSRSTFISPTYTENKIYSLTEIRDGLHAQQFSAYFQPKVECASGKLIGVEALARWLHPEYGMINPNNFIPLIEQNNLIEELTLLMVNQSVALCLLLHKIGMAITFSINLSPSSLDHTDLPNKIMQIVHNANLNPKYIMLEVTESAAISNNPYALENLARLCMHGFLLSIDDFGTGYSSMQQLTRIAFSELKIDQSFINDFIDNPSQKIVVNSSLEIARQLNLTTVAEGVETQQQWDALKALGCDAIQGYFISKPMKHDDFIIYAKKMAQ